MDRDELKLSSFAVAALEEITDLEHSKLVRTFRTLFFQPGSLTNDYLRGQRRSLLGPVKIYLTLFAISFLLYTFHRPTAVYDVSTIIAQDSSGIYRSLLTNAAKEAHLSESAAIVGVNARWRSYINVTQALYPLGLAILLQLIYIGTGRYFVEHLIFALHFNSVAFGVIILLWPIYAVIGVQTLTLAYGITTVVSLLLPFIWLLIAVRRVYRQGWWPSVIKSVILETGYLVMGLVLTFLTLGAALAVVARSH